MKQVYPQKSHDFSYIVLCHFARYFTLLPMSSPARRILVLYRGGFFQRPAIRHHLRTLDASPRRHEIVYYDTMFGCPAWLRRVAFDVVVLHTSFLWPRWQDDFDVIRTQTRWIGDLRCLKLALPQDEYDHAEV